MSSLQTGIGSTTKNITKEKNMAIIQIMAARTYHLFVSCLNLPEQRCVDVFDDFVLLLQVHEGVETVAKMLRMLCLICQALFVSVDGIAGHLSDAAVGLLLLLIPDDQGRRSLQRLSRIAQSLVLVAAAASVRKRLRVLQMAQRLHIMTVSCTLHFKFKNCKIKCD